MLLADQLTQHFAQRPVLQDFSWRGERGSVTAICGANGAGKTTLLRCLAGLAAPDAGTVVVNGSRYYFGEADHLYQHATVEENLTLAQQLAGRTRQDRAAAVAQWGVAPWLAKPVGTLSRGERRRVAAARVWLIRPDWLLLDEPFVALDQPAMECMARAIGAAAQAAGVVLAVQTVPPELQSIVTATIELRGRA